MDGGLGCGVCVGDGKLLAKPQLHFGKAKEFCAVVP